MTALKLNRFSLTEIERVTIRCRKCGAGHIVSIDGEQFNAEKCPSCGAPYGGLARDVYLCLEEAHKAMGRAKEFIDIEFDIIEK
jgi:Zn finger protein HypA/HybF involved in hydrogenase expression